MFERPHSTAKARPSTGAPRSRTGGMVRHAINGVLALAIGLFAFASCTSNETPPPAGGLIVVVDSDMAAPADFDRLTIRAEHAGQVLLSGTYEVGAGHALLPKTFKLGPTGDGQPVTITAVAYKGSRPLVEHHAITPMPPQEIGMIRLPLDFLCIGTAVPEPGGLVGSTCPAGGTCSVGSCVGAEIRATDLAPYSAASVFGGGVGPSSGTAADRDAGRDGSVGSGGSGGSGRCFDVTACFATASAAPVDPAKCSIAWTPGSEADLNVGLRLPPGSNGVCTADACWIALNRGTPAQGGWAIAGSNILLPPGVCKPPRGTPSFALAVSTGCASKTVSTPICGAWSSVTTPGTVSMGTPPVAMMGTGMNVGEACMGSPTEGCGNCGTRFRTCTNGSWSDWSACSGEGECAKESVRSCGAAGIDKCDLSCTWGACGGQACTGPSTRSCGNCGTQTRTCDSSSGSWLAWSACTGEGVCAPNATQSCGAGGTQGCGGACQWGACTNQVCMGAATRACGNCGTQSHTCNAATGMWSPWGPCSNEGACAPNASKGCGTGGTETCGGSCQWGGCTNQTCSGAATQACGNCGTQTRTCDSNTGAWSGWSACGGQGACAPNSTQSCGSGGSQSCGGTCAWGSCTNQVCNGPATQSCGNCGTQTRTCNANTGAWSPWSTCGGQGVCAPNSTQSCGSGGSQSCGGSCTWGACTGQTCNGPMTQPCGNCGTQSRACDTNTGNWSNWGACTSQGCAPGSTQSCGNGGSQTCGSSCGWGACTGQMCSGSATRPCGNCGTQSQAPCDTNRGTWSNWGACTNQGCLPGSIQSCGNGGSQTCDSSCGWGACTGQMCSGSATRPCGNCGTQSQAPCNTNTGTWSSWGGCTNQGCAPGSTQSCGSGGTQTCTQSCGWGSCNNQTCQGPSSRSCGNCLTGTQTHTCDPATGNWSPSWGPCTGQGCAPGATQSCGSGGTQTCTNNCTWGTACTGQSCPAGPSSQPCGNCGTQTRMCNSDTGQWSPWTCNQPAGACFPGTVTTCGNHASSLCSNACTTGSCVCDASYTMCGSACIDLTSDVNNCGACGNFCPQAIDVNGNALGGASCQNSTCGMPVCPSNLQRCTGGACFDVTNDANNCGSCGTACQQAVDFNGNTLGAATATCQNSTCGSPVCPSNLPLQCSLFSSTWCADPTSDANDCGSCLHVCPQAKDSGGNPLGAATATCQNSTCSTVCPASYTACGNGTCCDGSQDCSAGMCINRPR